MCGRLRRMSPLPSFLSSPRKMPTRPRSKRPWTPGSDRRKDMSSLLLDSNLWVAVGLVIFLAIVLRFGVHKLVGQKLDERAAGIKQELEEARRLREEAQQLLASYQRKQRE